ncbi:predicted protein [Streptomyces viridochromogenes DSM 40736]|uniref:Predicted protein n=1 Tax=Streptomyces viridochromogenes (strain DSM 40736 / JCM 4977 / BCRC 1201 / Tue 494) TaxID=591159 RepID=D9XC69_STRVT|nr:predicted protein [Streptomyces viridochromogenes DSM 40736]
MPAEGDPLHGSVRLAAELTAGSLTLPGDETMLCVTTPRVTAQSGEGDDHA